MELSECLIVYVIIDCEFGICFCCNGFVKVVSWYVIELFELWVSIFQFSVIGFFYYMQIVFFFNCYFDDFNFLFDKKLVGLLVIGLMIVVYEV